MNRCTSDRPISLGIFLLALAVRLLYLWDVSDSPTFLIPVVDAGTYDELARSLVEGHGVTEKFFWQPCFYPAFLAVVYFLSHASVVCAKVLQMMLGAATCVLTWQLGRRIFGGPVGVLAGLIASLYGPLIFFDGELLATGWACFWSVALLTLFLRVAEDAEAGGVSFFRDVLLLGLCVGLSVLTRPTFLIFTVAGGVWLACVLAVRRAGWRRIVGGLATVAVLAGVVVLPVAWQGYKVTGALGIMPMSDGLNLHIGNNPDRAQTVSIRPGWEWDHLTRLPQREGATTWREGRLIFREKFREYVRTRPLDFARGLGAKAVEFVSSREIPRNVDVYLFRKWSWLLRILVWKVSGFGFPFGLLLPLAFMGTLQYWKRIPVVVILFTVFYGASIVVVFMSARYRMPVVPVMTILASAGCFALRDLFTARRWCAAFAALVGGVAVVLVSSVPGPFAQEQTEYEGEMYYILGSARMRQADNDEAQRLLTRALELDPGHASAANHLGLVLQRKGVEEEAERCYRLAVEVNPDHATAHVNLGNLFWGRGEAERAITHYRQALRVDPNDARAHNGLGAALAKQGRFWDAVYHFKEAARIGTESTVGVFANLGTALCELGKFDEGIHCYRAAVRQDPGEAAKPDSFLDNLAKFGRTNEVVSIYCEALRKAEETGNAALAAAIRAKLSRYEGNP